MLYQMSSRIRFRNYRSDREVYLVFINKWVGFSQSFSRILKLVIMSENQISPNLRFIEIMFTYNYLN